MPVCFGLIIFCGSLCYFNYPCIPISLGLSNCLCFYVVFLCLPSVISSVLFHSHMLSLLIPAAAFHVSSALVLFNWFHSNTHLSDHCLMLSFTCALSPQVLPVSQIFCKLFCCKTAFCFILLKCYCFFFTFHVLCDVYTLGPIQRQQH